MRYVIVVVIAVIFSGCATTGNRSTIGHDLSMTRNYHYNQEVMLRGW